MSFYLCLSLSHNLCFESIFLYLLEFESWEYLLPRDFLHFEGNFVILSSNFRKPYHVIWYKVMVCFVRVSFYLCLSLSHSLCCKSVYNLCLSLSHGFNWVIKTMANVWTKVTFLLLDRFWYCRSMISQKLTTSQVTFAMVFHAWVKTMIQTQIQLMNSNSKTAHWL